MTKQQVDRFVRILDSLSRTQLIHLLAYVIQKLKSL